MAENVQNVARRYEVDPRTLEMLVCPLTKSVLEYDAERQELVSRAAKLAYPIRDGIRSGWNVRASTSMADGTVLEADVIIIGTGAGGGTTAEILANAGLKVLVLEEGPLKSSRDFRMDEREAYRDLCQESAGRMSKDGAMSILQGRCVGGTTVINWTSSFRTPEPTLQHWASEFGVQGMSKDEMAPWFEQMEPRLNVAPWQVPANTNNAVMSRGATSLRTEIPQLRLSGLAHFGYGGSNLLYPLLVTEDLRQPLLACSVDFLALAFWPAAPGSIRQLFPAPAFTVPGSLIPEVMPLLAPFIALCIVIRLIFR